MLDMHYALEASIVPRIALVHRIAPEHGKRVRVVDTPT